MPVEIIAMSWVDTAQGVHFRWWLGDEPRPAGLRPEFQVAECRVDGAIVAVLWSHPPAAEGAWCEAIRILRDQLGADAVISLVDGDVPGRSRQSALTPVDGESARLRVALAVAIAKASWGWDESDQIQVEDEAGVWSVRPTRTRAGWSATASRT